MAELGQYSFVSLADVKSYVGISDTANDGDIKRLINSTCDQVERHCEHKMRRRNYTEYHDGDGKSAMIHLKEYPIVRVDLVYDDPDRDFGATTVVSTDDWTFAPGEGRSPGYIELYGGEVSGTTGRITAGHLYFKRGVRNLKTNYTAGYADFRVTTGSNDKINFLEADGGSELTATLTSGEYDADEMETEVETQLDSAGGATYTVTYSDTTNRFTVSSSSDFLSIKWNSGMNTDSGAHGLLGYSAAADDTGATSYAGDDPVGSVPDSLADATIQLVTLNIKRSGLGVAGADAQRIGILSAAIDNMNVRFDPKEIPDHIRGKLTDFHRLSFF